MQDGNASNNFDNLNNKIGENNYQKTNKGSGDNLLTFSLFFGVAGVSD